MARMVSLKRPKPDKADTTERAQPYPEDEGMHVHLDHHHLDRMGLGGKLKAGDKVKFSGEGRVERSETSSGNDGDRHSATLRLHKGGVDHDEAEEYDSPRGELEKSYAASQAKRRGK